jgi:ATP-dependent Lhr-like helicase
MLSKKMQKKIWDMKWDSFTPIQDKTIPVIMNTDKDVIISSGTASGKTEAAFLPILSLIEESAKSALKVIYISPLKALINNQFQRINRLCSDLDISIYRWHGDIDQGKKNKLIKSPSGILQITPESIESILINRTEKAHILFKDVDFVIIDEIHSFIDRERGIQLRSLLYRMEHYCSKKLRIIGLSATIGDYNTVKRWINIKNVDNVEVIEAKDSNKDLYYYLMHTDTNKDGKIPLELFEDIRELTRESKAIIFCNSRGMVEETIVILNRLAQKEGINEAYLAHHSSIDKKEREYVEKTMVEANHPKSVVATSSLELGIDIGEIELVVQIDSTFTVSSLKQRLGRSGRKKTSNQMLQLYTTSSDSLLQSLSVMELLKENWIEGSHSYALPYDILFHQIISLCNETNGIVLEDLLNKIASISIFQELPEDKIRYLIKHMAEKDYLEIIRGKNEYIVGLGGERLLRSKEFYSVFMTPEEYVVQHGNKPIGKIDKRFMINEGDNIILAGKLWTIISIDTKRNKVYVNYAANAKPPKYFGSGLKLDSKILEKIMEILCSETEFNYINEDGDLLLKDLRKAYRFNGIDSKERVIWIDREEMVFETFTGTKVFRTLVWMLRAMGTNVKIHDALGRISIESAFSILDVLNKIKAKNWEPIELLQYTKDDEVFVSKYLEYLPEDLQIEMHIAHEVDIAGVKEFLDRYKIRVIEG